LGENVRGENQMETKVGHYRSAAMVPLIVDDTSFNPFAFKQVMTPDFVHAIQSMNMPTLKANDLDFEHPRDAHKRQQPFYRGLKKYRKPL
jgi:hypothetical protein